MFGYINKKTAKGKTNGAVKNHGKTLLALAAKGCNYKVNETDDLIKIEGTGFLTIPFNLDQEKPTERFVREVLKEGKLISYKMGVIRNGAVLKGTYACQAVKAVLPPGSDAVICHSEEPRKATARPTITDAIQLLDLPVEEGEATS